VLVINLGKIPVFGTDVLQLSPNATARPAREGSYAVSHFSQPTTPYKNYADGGNTSMSPFAPRGYSVYYQVEVSDGSGLITFIPVNGSNSPVPGTHEELAMFDFTATWHLFEGLSVQPATSTATTVTPPYLTIKNITGYEAQAYPNSILGPFMENSAPPDSRALELASMINHASVSSLPAKANFWGAIGTALLSAAPTIISALKSVFGKKKEATVTPRSLPKPSAPPAPQRRRPPPRPPAPTPQSIRAYQARANPKPQRVFRPRRQQVGPLSQVSAPRPPAMTLNQRFSRVKI